MANVKLTCAAVALSAFALINGCALDASETATPDAEVGHSDQAIAVSPRYIWGYFGLPAFESTWGLSFTHAYSTDGVLPLLDSLGDGHYSVALNNFAPYRGNPQLTAVGSDNVRCAFTGHTRFLQPGNDWLTYDVECFKPDGSPAASKFVFSYQVAGEGDRGAYLLADQPTNPNSYWAADSWNSSGYSNFVARQQRGVYVVALPGAYQGDGHFGGVMVSSFGNTASHCKAIGEQYASSYLYVTVGCLGLDGSLQDSKFFFSLTNRAAPFSGSTGGYAYGGGGVGTSFVTAPSYASFDAYLGYAPQHKRTSDGVLGGYTTRFRNHSANYVSYSAALVNAFGNNGDYCKSAGWSIDANGNVDSKVNCYKATGQRVDSTFETRLLIQDSLIK